MMETIYLAGGCLWSVQAFIKTLNGVITTEAGRANGNSTTLYGECDGYAECVKTIFDPSILPLSQLLDYFFEIIDPYSINKQGNDVGKKYRTGIYSEDTQHLRDSKEYIERKQDSHKIMVEVLPLLNYVKSANEHQDRLDRYPEDYSYCHLPKQLLNKYKNKF